MRLGPVLVPSLVNSFCLRLEIQGIRVRNTEVIIISSDQSLYLGDWYVCIDSHAN